MNKARLAWLAPAVLAAALAAPALGGALPEETAQLTYAPNVPPPITRRTPALVRVNLVTQEVDGDVMPGLDEPTRYHFWTFNGHVPGPFIRVRVGDTIEVHLTNPATNGMAHDIDLHAVSGPGGGAAVTLAQPGETKVARFKMRFPGLFAYHCAAPPVTDHIANGMYGLILVEPAEGMPKADKEFYVMQGELYTKEEFGFEGMTHYDSDKAADEKPTYIVFNGKWGSLNDDNALQAKTGERVRIYFGNGGPNKTSSFHVIGALFEKLYREGGGLPDHPEINVQTTSVPPGSGSIVEFTPVVPGNYTLVDHAIFRIQKGASGTLHVTGPANPEVYSGTPNDVAEGK